MQVLQLAIFLIEKNYNHKNYKTSVSFVFIIFVLTCTRFVLRKQNSQPPPPLYKDRVLLSWRLCVF